MDEYSYGKRVTLVGSVLNMILSGVKLAIGFFAGSLALIADGFHSLSDLASDIIVMVGLTFAGKEDDETHHYGHGKFETLAAFLIGVFLAGAGIGIIKTSIETLIEFSGGGTIGIPGILALFAAIVSVIAKELLFRYTKRAAEKINSPSVLANAWHHRSDAFSSIGAALGIAGARFLGGTWVLLDPVAGIIVGLILLKESFSIMKDNLAQLLEAALPEEYVQKILKAVENVEECYDPHKIRTRRVGKRIVVDIHIRVSADYTIKKGHEIAHNVIDKLKEALGKDSMINVHTEPLYKEKRDEV